MPTSDADGKKDIAVSRGLTSHDVAHVQFCLLSVLDSTSDRMMQPGIEALRSGGVVALPTDTIYGIASLAQNSKAVRNLYHIKRRSARKPLAICVGTIDQLYQ